MTSDEIGKWLTLTANFGVLIGIILLLIELNQNSDLLTAQIHQARSDAFVTKRLDIADSEYLLPAYRKFRDAGGFLDMNAMDELDPDEFARIREFFVAYHRDYDNLYYQYQQGYLDDEFYEYSIQNSIRLFAPWWKRLGIAETGSRRPSFDAEVRRIMEEYEPKAN